MIRPASDVLAPAPPKRRKSRRALPHVQPPDGLAYDVRFWIAYLSNILFMAGVSLLYRFADFVTALGGSELDLGWIVGVGMIGSLLARVTIGAAIDVRGSRLIWLVASLLLAASCFGNLWVTAHNGPLIYVLRILFSSTIAAVVGASMTFVTSRGPQGRLGELVGMYGTSGFLGVMVGTQLGDLIAGNGEVSRATVDWLFILAGSSILLASLAALIATRGHPRPVITDSHAPAWEVLRRYFSLPVFAVGTAMGGGMVLVQTFLRTYTQKYEIGGIGTFFGLYAAAAVATRVVTRRWPDRFGAGRMMIVGLLALAVSELLILPVQTEWHLALSGAIFGFSQAVLFPAVVSAGTIHFPVRHRGLATTVVLSSWDVGLLIGAPLGGLVLHSAESFGMRPYATLFVSAAVVLAGTAGYYAMTMRKAAS